MPTTVRTIEFDMTATNSGWRTEPIDGVVYEEEGPPPHLFTAVRVALFNTPVFECKVLEQQPDRVRVRMTGVSEVDTPTSR